MSNKLQDGFEQGKHDNLPKVDTFMVFDYLNNNLKYTSTEIRGWKLKRSGRETYGDDAVGYVQVQREGDRCTVKAKITPEHKIKSKAYSCTFMCDEKQEIVISVECHDCAAQKGGCKHGIAFLLWLHRRSEEPSPTVIKCYWAKPKLAAVGTTIKFIKAKDIGSCLHSSSTNDQSVNINVNIGGQFLTAVVQSLQEDKVKNQLSTYCIPIKPFKNISLHSLIFEYQKRDNILKNAEDFIDFCSKQMTTDECRRAEEATLSQANSALWYELRYCRITASEVHEAAYCKTPDSVLVEQLFGAPLPETAAMERGKWLEPDVRAIVAKKRKTVIEQCGLFLKPDSPMLGASPDGLTSEFVVVIKCPSTKKGIECFFKNNAITKKFKAQIQLQMFFCNKDKGLFCIADENFEDNKKVEIFEEYYDHDFCMDLIEKSTQFWKQCVFPKLIET